MALRLLGAGPPAAGQVRALQQFIGAGAWDDPALLAEHQRVVAASLGEHDGLLILAGREVHKRGVQSAGVAAQWWGATGKTDTCQAGVFLGYASRTGDPLLDRRLFLPEPWVDDAHAPRWRACRIPADVVFRTKAQLAAEMVEQVQQRGDLPATGLVCDAWLGRTQARLERVPAAGPSEPAELKSYLSPAPADTPLAALIRVCGMRWAIDCCFEEGKGQVGRDHDE